MHVSPFELLRRPVPSFRRLTNTTYTRILTTMNEVLSALQTLYTDPSNAAKEQANQWLQSFQKEVRPGSGE